MENIQSILVPVDFSTHTDKIIATAKKMTETFNAETTLLYVTEGFAPFTGFVVPHMSIDVLEDEMVEQAEAKLKAIIEDYFDSGLKCSARVIRGEDVADDITACATEQQVDMIIMGSHGYKGLEKTLMGSVAEKVIKSVKCLVLIVKPS